jgi:hypothetical protein
MPKFQVTGTVKYRFDREIEAADEEEAESIVEDMEYSKYSTLIESAGMPDVDVEDVNELKQKKAAGRRG